MLPLTENQSARLHKCSYIDHTVEDDSYIGLSELVLCIRKDHVTVTVSVTT